MAIFLLNITLIYKIENSPRGRELDSPAIDYKQYFLILDKIQHIKETTSKRSSLYMLRYVILRQCSLCLTPVELI